MVSGCTTACLQGVSHYEPGGLSVRQVLDVIHAMHPAPADITAAGHVLEDYGIPRPQWTQSERYVVGADVVEYNVVRDIGGRVGVGGSLFDGDEARPGMTAMVGAKLLKELAALLHRSRAKMSVA